jgi:hypothetical protein
VLASIAILIFAMVLLVGVLVPLVLNVPASMLPAAVPAFDGGAFLILVVGELLAAFLVIAFAALITLIVRNGAIAMVGALIWVAVEAAVLTLLFRFPNFSQQAPMEGLRPTHGCSRPFHCVA